MDRDVRVLKLSERCFNGATSFQKWIESTCRIGSLSNMKVFQWSHFLSEMDRARSTYSDSYMFQWSHFLSEMDRLLSDKAS